MALCKEWIKVGHLKIFFAFLLLCVVFLLFSYSKLQDSYEDNLGFHFPILATTYRFSLGKLLQLQKSHDDSLEFLFPNVPDIIKFSLKKTLEQNESEAQILSLARVIYNAHKHARGLKTTDYLSTATFIVNEILKEKSIDPEEFYRRQTKLQTNVCPEAFMGDQFGFPIYENGFVTQTCENAVPIRELITVIKYMYADLDASGVRFSPEDELRKFIVSVNDTYNGLPLLIATDSVTFSRISKYSSSWVKIINSKQLDAGSALKSLIKEVKTPYVLVARNINTLTNDSRLERLIREIESLDVAAVGGSFRDQNGHWKNGCFQTVFKNFTLKYFEGYDESMHECLFCDYIHGPFVTTTKYLKENPFERFNETSGLYGDWFLQIFQKGHETVVCPDSMFHVVSIKSQTNADWKGFLEKRNLVKIFTPCGYSFTLNCTDQKELKTRTPSLALSPCVVQRCSEAIKFIMKTCEDTGAICELQEGTILGALKMGKVLPWDIDFDIRFLATNCTICKKLEHVFKMKGISFKPFANPCCAKQLKMGEIIDASLRYKGFSGDFSGHPVLQSDRLIKAGFVPTKILFDGQWVNVPRSPGFFARNRYGKELYRHAEHWRYTGGRHTHHRINYTTNVFLPCKYPKRHNCLDRYKGDGNLQFIYLLP